MKPETQGVQHGQKDDKLYGVWQPVQGVSSLALSELASGIVPTV